MTRPGPHRPYIPAPYDTAPAQGAAGWYAGDFHVHAEHSSLGDATMRETFDYAFRPLAAGGAGLDFITLSDYVSDTAWGEIGRYQPDYPGRLIARSAEIITYRGHANNHASARYVDYRTGPVYERMVDGSFGLARAARPASTLFDGVHDAGGFTQINHPTIFPSAVPGFDFLCRGCPWDYTDGETDYSKVDAIEVSTGPAGLQQDPEPGPNPFTPAAIQFYEHAIDAGGANTNHIAAVGSSDSHNAGRTPDPVTQAPIGTATTVVYADELSEQGIARGVKAGPHIRQGVRQRRARPSLHGRRARSSPRDHGRHHPRGRRRADRPRARRRPRRGATRRLRALRPEGRSTAARDAGHRRRLHVHVSERR